MGKVVTIGVVPIKRAHTNMQSALEQKELILKRTREVCPSQVELVDLEGVLENGILWGTDQLQTVEDHLRAKRVDALFLPHCDFGCEEVVGKIGAIMKMPVLLWGNRDPQPRADGGWDRDTQCGTLASSKALQRFGVKFSYIVNSDVNGKQFEKGFTDYCRVAAVVAAFRDLRILQVGSRPQPFFSVIVNEDELITKYGVEIVPYSAGVCFKEATALIDGNDADMLVAYEEIKARYDYSKMEDQKIKALAAIRVAIRKKAAQYKCAGVAMECWTNFAPMFGVAGCQVIGALNDEGLPTACETDVLGAMTSVMLRAASLGEETVLFADITVRHPEDDNCELLWHCGPFPYALRKPDSKPWLDAGGRQQFPLKNGDITIGRMDMIEGKYSFFVGEGKGVDGPYKHGNHVWLKVDDWEKWEEKIVFGPYIHHVAGVYGNYEQVIAEACKYINVCADNVNPVKRVLG